MIKAFYRAASLFSGLFFPPPPPPLFFFLLKLKHIYVYKYALRRACSHVYMNYLSTSNMCLCLPGLHKI